MQLQSISIFIKFVYPCLAFCICCLPSSYRALNILKGYVNVPLNFVAVHSVQILINFVTAHSSFKGDLPFGLAKRSTLYYEYYIVMILYDSLIALSFSVIYEPFFAFQLEKLHCQGNSLKPALLHQTYNTYTSSS